LAVDQRIAHVEILRHPDERIVNGRVAVGMVIPHDLAHDFGGLAIGPVGGQTHFVHAVQNTAMHRLEPVTDVGKRPANDHAHGIIEVR
jgi:hypothetical protein